MNKLIIAMIMILALGVCGMICGIAYAAPVPNGYTLLIEETIDDDPTTSTSSKFFIGDKKKVAFIVNAVETASVDDSSITVSIKAHIASTSIAFTPFAIDLLMTDGGTDAPVSSIAYTASGGDVFYLPEDFIAPYIVAYVAGTSTDASDYYDVDVWVTWQQ